MTKEEKSRVIEDLTAQLAGTNVVYVTDISGLNAENTSIILMANSLVLNLNISL